MWRYDDLCTLSSVTGWENISAVGDTGVINYHMDDLTLKGP